jgi:hypothetical protein
MNWFSKWWLIAALANHHHDITMTTRPGAQNAKTILGPMLRAHGSEGR